MKIGDKVTVKTTKNAMHISPDGLLARYYLGYSNKAVVVATGCVLPTFFNDGHEPSNDTIIYVCGEIVFIHHSHLEPVEPEPNLRRIDLIPEYAVGTKYQTELETRFVYIMIDWGSHITYNWQRVR